jgi:1-acyl-sn-glycerol-3-phosphate acyltransferase
MIYSMLRWIAGIALHWFYRDIRVVERDRIPQGGPLLIAVNHQNALVDSLLVSWVIPRRIALTAKATLADNPLIAFVFKLLRVVPLRRAADETEHGNGARVDPSRNTQAFGEIVTLLQRNGAVLIFPEGKSHNESGLEPLKTGLARLALLARDKDRVRGLKILPLGLVFEDKGAPDSVASAQIGLSIDMDTWSGSDPVKLTEEITDRLRRVSQDAELPTPQRSANQENVGFAHELLISLAAWWGRLTHGAPIRMARSIAVKRSTSADEPAMLTILFGIGLVLLTYAVHLTIVGLLAHSIFAVCLYFVALVNGAYWAAFQRHPRDSQL